MQRIDNSDILPSSLTSGCIKGYNSVVFVCNLRMDHLDMHPYQRGKYLKFKQLQFWSQNLYYILRTWKKLIKSLSLESIQVINEVYLDIQILVVWRFYIRDVNMRNTRIYSVWLASLKSCIRAWFVSIFFYIKWFE